MARPALYILDFDGVLCDSTTECMVTSWNAWERWNDSPGFRSSSDAFTDHEIQSFRRVRPRVRGAGEYYVVRRSLADDDEIVDQSDYEKRVSLSRESISSFKPVFMSQREKLRAASLENWLALHTSFPAVTTFAERMAEESRLYIATLKDRASVQAILATLGVALTDSRIVDESQVTSKLEALSLICGRENLSKDDVLFIDDNVTHLVDPHNHGFHVRQSTWGNVLPESLQQGRANGIPEIGLEELSSLT